MELGKTIMANLIGIGAQNWLLILGISLIVLGIAIKFISSRSQIKELINQKKQERYVLIIFLAQLGKVAELMKKVQSDKEILGYFRDTSVAALEKDLTDSYILNEYIQAFKDSYMINEYNDFITKMEKNVLYIKKLENLIYSKLYQYNKEIIEQNNTYLMLKDTVLTKEQEHELEEIKRKIHEDSVELNNIKTFVNQKREELSAELNNLIQQCQNLEIYVYNKKKKSLRAKTINFVNVAYV